MRQRVIQIVLCAGAASGLVLAALSPASAAQAGGPRWQVVFTSPRASALTSVVATGRRDAWATGWTGNAGYVLHWNGSAWRQVRVPGTGRCYPSAVQATSPDNVWVQCADDNGASKTIAYNGSAWRTLPTPEAAAQLLASATVSWGASPAVCAGGPGGAASACTSQVTRYEDGTATTFQVPGYVAAMARGGSGQVWVLAETAVHGTPGPTASGQPLIYEGGPGFWRQTPAPAAQIAQFPQLAASPGGRVWILDWHVRPHKYQVLSYWNGHTWTRRAVPLKQLEYGSWGFTYDGHGGVWLGPYAHWTGSGWVKTSPGGVTSAYNLTAIAPVPGTRSAWAVGWTTGRHSHALITLLGPRP